MQYRKKPARHPWQVLLSDRRCVGINKAPSLLIINTLQLSLRTKVHCKNHPSCPMQLHFCRLAVFCCSCIVPLMKIYRAFVPILRLYSSLPSRR